MQSERRVAPGLTRPANGAVRMAMLRRRRL